MAFFRIVKFSLQDIFRNISLSFMTVFILVLMLLSINALIAVRVLTGQAISEIKSQIDVSIHFNYEATAEEIEEVKTVIGAFPEVTETVFLTSEEVLADFQAAYQDNPDIIAALEELDENPLGPTLIVKTRDTGDYQKVIDALDVPEYESIIEAKTFADTQKAIERIQAITAQVEQFSWFLTVLFALIAFVIIFNTIRVAIYTQRAEIGIKKLVGATNWFVRGPYLIESLLFTVLSTLVAALVVFFALTYIDPLISVIFQQPGLLTNYYSSHILELAGFQFVAVLLLTTLTSLLAMRRYLRV